MRGVSVVLQVTNSPFNQEQAELLNRLLPALSDSQRIWLSGYLTALQSTASVVAEPGAIPGAAPATAPAISKEVTLLYGSQTGNSQRLSKKLKEKLESQGFAVSMSSMGDFKTNALKKVENLLIIVSTHGEGDPPDNAIPFHEFLHSKRAPQLEGARFSVLALGDTSYEFFCQTGKDFDKRLEELGAARLVPRVDCDVDYDDAAAGWMDQVVSALSASSAAPAGAAGSAASAVSAGLAAGTAEYSRTNPFHAEVLENLNLNGRGSERETRHLELSLEGSNLTYEPGDCLAVFPKNHPQLVDDIIAAMGWREDELVPAGKAGEEKPLREALAEQYEITLLTKPVLENIAKASGRSELEQLVSAERAAELKAYTNGRDLLDLIGDYQLKGMPARELVSALRKLPARQYSIASSLRANPDEVHLTIRKVEFEAHGRQRYGVCSSYTADRLAIGETVPVYVHQNPNFKLPDNPDTPLIMIGPGTGVAPFRAFLADREETGAEGKTWLFYGDQRFSTDFLYQTDWQRWLKDGVLTRMDVAFSRDTDKKVYVQHRMQEKSKDLYEWLQEGAHVYVCGDEKRMAHDVHAALTDIIAREGGFSAEEAAEYLARMQRDRRYQRDVY